LETRKNKLLILEDDNLNQLVYKRILSKEYDVVICGDDKEFDSAINRDTYDLFIIDLAINCERDGIDLIKELRQTDQYRNTAIIVVTAFAFRKDRENCMAAGATEFMVKPFDNINLLEAIEKYL